MITSTETGSFTATDRGVDYFLRTDAMGRFAVTSQRRALRAARMGGSVRFFKTLAEVEQSIKAFKGISAFAAMEAGAAN